MSALRNRTGNIQTYLRVYRTPIVAASLALLFVTAGLTVAAQTIRRPSRTKVQPPIVVAEVAVPEIVAAPSKPEPVALPATKEEIVLPAPTEVVRTPEPAKVEVQQARRKPAAERKRTKPHAKPDVPTKDEDAGRTVKPPDPPSENHGTTVRFVGFPDMASLQASREDKLVFILHVSGNFEDPGFT